MDNQWRDFWNQRFAEHETVYGTEPNAYFRSFIDRQEKKGDLLLPAEGEGRNAVYAAKQGWKVDAFDFSVMAREKALIFALKEAVSIHYELKDIRDYKAKKQYDGIALLYVHLDPALRVSFHREIARSLKPGGWLLLEAFTPLQLQYKSGGPKDIAMLYDSTTLRSDFAELQIGELSESVIQLAEGPFHQGDAALIRMLARHT